MKITISVSDADARAWLWFLRQRYKSKASLKNLVKKAIIEIIKQQADMSTTNIND